MEDQKQQLAQQQQQLLLMQQQMQRRNDAVSRFPSNIDAHLRPSLLQHHRLPQNPNPNPNPNPQINPNSQNQQPPIPTTTTTNAQIQSPVHQQHQQQQKAALQLAYQDAWRVCHPDFKRPFSSLEDACERLLPYHVVADYEAEEDDKILDSDSTGQILSRSQQWDHNIAAKVSEFTATFEKQVLAFNIISKKRSLGEFRTEEKLMMEQLLLQDEKRALLESRAARMEDSRQKASRETQEAQMRMAAAMEQARVESQAHHAEMMARAAPIRANALGPRGGSGGIDMGEQDQEDVQHEEAINGWGGNAQKDDKDEPSEDFLNDDETDNGDTALQGEWQGGGEFDLNAR